MNYTVAQWMEHWMETCVKPASRLTTYAAHGYLMHNHILPGLGNIMLAELIENDVGEFFKACETSGNHRPGSAGYPGLGTQTLRHIRSLLHKCLAQAVSDGLIASNPAQPFNYSTPRSVTANPLTEKELELYLDAAEELGHLAMFTLELTTGLRQRELIALKWSDVYMENSALTVTKSRVVECGRLVECPENVGLATRIIPLSPQVARLLVQEHAQRSAVRPPRHPQALFA